MMADFEWMNKHSFDNSLFFFQLYLRQGLGCTHGVRGSYPHGMRFPPVKASEKSNLVDHALIPTTYTRDPPLIGKSHQGVEGPFADYANQRIMTST